MNQPVFLAKYNENRAEIDAQIGLLGTIKMPRDLSLLGGRLPKAQYSDAEPTAKITERPSEGKPPVTQRHRQRGSLIKRIDSAQELADYQSRQSHDDLLINNQLVKKQEKIVAQAKKDRVLSSKKDRAPSGKRDRVQSGKRDRV